MWLYKLIKLRLKMFVKFYQINICVFTQINKIMLKVENK